MAAMLNDDRIGRYFDGTCHWPLVGAFFLGERAE